MEEKTIVEVFKDSSLYPHVCGDIRMIETHISWVFLAGDYAYKIKKPVNFGFLDFSTLEKRRRYCHEELARNSVFASDIYLDVLAIKHDDGVWHLSANLDDAHEYAVRMKRFSQSDLLLEKMRAGEFEADDAFALGVGLAELTNKYELAALDTQWGSQEAVAHPLLENFEQVIPLLFDKEDLDRAEYLQQWTKDRLSALASLLAERRQERMIKACHGDLHLNNILWRDGKAIPFDCIEFNDEFRWIDVMNELAFLLMDMEHNDQWGAANHCLNGYLESSGDYSGVELVTFYKVYRAMVRAKVAILRWQQNSLADEEKHQLYQEYESYIALAERYIQQEKPCLYITHGVSGSGKSTMARFVSGKINAIHIRSDVERKRLFGFTASDKSDSEFNAGIYTKEATVKTFHRLEDICKVLTQSGKSVIVDATFLRQSKRNQFLSLAKELDVPFAILDCAIDEETARNRVKSRMEQGEDASEADLKVLENQLSDQDYLSPEEQRYVVVIDMGEPLENIDLASLYRGEHIGD